MPAPLPQPGARFGAHMPTAGGLHNAIYAARDVGANIAQVFTKSPQQWRAREITDEQVEQFLEAQKETGIPCVSSHDTYLINPCSADAELLQKSRDALVDEVRRSTRLRIPFVVMHLGTPGPCEPGEGVGRLIDTIKYVLDNTETDGSVLLLETMAGQGKCIGAEFEDLGRVIQEVGGGERLGVCLDTCHIFAAGYDLRTLEAYEKTMADWDAIIGLDRVRLVHANDSKKELGSRVDRHEAIGQGCIGPEGFRLLLQDSRLSRVPVVLETPKEGEMDPINLAALRRAAGLAQDA